MQGSPGERLRQLLEMRLPLNRMKQMTSMAMQLECLLLRLIRMPGVDLLESILWPHQRHYSAA